MVLWKKVVAVLFMAASLAQGVAGVRDARIPGWQMFKQMDRYTYEIRDADGEPVDLRDFVFERAYSIVDLRSVFGISAWVAERYPERAPLGGTLQVWNGQEWEAYRFQVVDRDQMGIAPRPTWDWFQ